MKIYIFIVIGLVAVVISIFNAPLPFLNTNLQTTFNKQTYSSQSELDILSHSALKRIIAIGDLHGDFKALEEILSFTNSSSIASAAFLACLESTTKQIECSEDACVIKIIFIL